MSYYDFEEDYYEPSEFDEKIDEFKNCLRESIKKETQELIKKLQKENEELRDIRDNWEEIKRDYDRKQRELQREIYNCKYNAAKMRLDELFEFCGMNVILYRPNWEYVYKPKCDKCDDDRYIHFESPSGIDCKEDCLCAKRFMKHKPEPYFCTEFRVNRQNNKLPMLMWFRKYKGYDDIHDGCEYVFDDLCTFIYNGENFETVEANEKNPYFRDEKQCQEYCEYLNKNNGITDDMTTERNVAVRNRRSKNV